MSEHFPAELLAQLPGLLVPWFLRAKRDLEWRNDPTPYRVWISEIMLQQTRVEAVKPYYDRFLAELPDVAALAAVDETRLLKLWEGLGYYRRARNLQAAAKKIMHDHGGVFPHYPRLDGTYPLAACVCRIGIGSRRYSAHLEQSMDFCPFLVHVPSGHVQKDL